MGRERGGGEREGERWREVWVDFWGVWADVGVLLAWS